MKKLLCVCAACLLVAALSTSCNKKCQCKTYVGGTVQSTWETELDKDSYNKCSDLNTVVTIAGTKNGIECKGTL
jgi:hypothetical protein